MKRALLCLSLLLAASARAQDEVPGLEERLTRLEQEVRALRAENDELRRQVRSLAPPSVPAPPPAPAAPVAKSEPASPKMSLGGLLQVQGESGGQLDSRFTDDHDRLFVRRARVNVQGSVRHGFDYRLEMDLAGSLSGTSGMRAQLTDAWAGWSAGSRFGLRAGQMKTPFGFEQLESDARLSTPERALVTDRIGVSRQLGILASGSAAAGRLNWSAGAFNGNGINTSANDDEGMLLAARVAGVLVRREGVRLGAGTNAWRSDDAAVLLPGDFGFDSTPATPARDGVFSGERRAWGADVQLDAGRGEMRAEMLRARFEPDDALPARVVESSGWYVQGGWFFVPRRVQGVLRYEAFDPSAAVSGDDTGTWLAGANYLVRGHDLKLQLHFMRSDAAGRQEERVIARVQTAF